MIQQNWFLNTENHREPYQLSFSFQIALYIKLNLITKTGRKISNFQKILMRFRDDDYVTDMFHA